MELEIQRLTDRDQVIALAPALAQLQEADLVALPHYRPVTGDEIASFAEADGRFAERAIIVATRGAKPVGWCHVEPPLIARTAGDLYPYAGGQIVFQPGLPHALADAEHSNVIRGLLYAASQVRAQQGAHHIELFTPENCGSEAALRAEGFQPVDNWATYLTTLGDRKAGRSPLSVSALRQPELELFPQKLRRLGLIEGEFTPDDLARVAGSIPGFSPQGLLIAEHAGEIIGYAAVMIDNAYVSATSRKRAWLGCGPLGMATLPGGEQEEWVRTIVSAACISAFCRGATELAFIGSAEGRQPVVWERLGFTREVAWRRWRAGL